MLKKFLCTIICLLTAFTAFAGSIPEDLLHSDDALVYFGEVVSVTDTSIEVKPTVKVKGDVITETKLIYDDYTAFDTEAAVGGTYLFGYFDEVNPLYIFETTSTDQKTLKIKSGGEFGQRMQDYLNEGFFEVEEQKRQNLGRQITLTEFLSTNKDNAEKVDFTVESGTYDIDTEKFFELADKIILTDVKDRLNEEMNGLYITVHNKNKENTGSFAFITKDGKVDRYSMSMSRLPMLEFTVSTADIDSLYMLLPSKAPEKIAVPFYTNHNFYIFVCVIIALLLTGVIIKKKVK